MTTAFEHSLLPYISVYSHFVSCADAPQQQALRLGFAFFAHGGARQPRNSTITTTISGGFNDPLLCLPGRLIGLANHLQFSPNPIPAPVPAARR